MGDEAVKIFLNAKGTLDDVSNELKAFLDYVAGKKPKDAYVERLEEAVKEAKKNREWRHEYMTLLMRDQENVKIGEEKMHLAEAFAEITDTAIYPTLNFRENPRWGAFQKRNTIEVSRRFDFIMLKNPYPEAFPTLKKYGIFGRDISKETGLAASDHYGVCVELEF